MTWTRRALTLLEMTAVLAILGVLAAVTTFGVTSQLSKTQKSGSFARLEAVRTAARTSYATNQNSFPEALSTSLSVSGIDVTDASSSANTVSLARASSTKVAIATTDGGSGCVGMVEDVTSSKIWYVQDTSVAAGLCSGQVLSFLR